jgi:2-(1,2-epoxy-1,2-dihydrophenyl)acetyl-CoA isomerase
MSKVWLVTGSSRGLGRDLARAVLAAGDRLVATARDPEQLRDVVALAPDRAIALKLDVTRSADARAAVEATVAKFGRLDVLVNNAGYAIMNSVEDMAEEDFRAQMDTNFFGVLHVTRAALPVMRAQASGHVIQISSIGGRIGAPGREGTAKRGGGSGEVYVKRLSAKSGGPGQAVRFERAAPRGTGDVRRAVGADRRAVGPGEGGDQDELRPRQEAALRRREARREGKQVIPMARTYKTMRLSISESKVAEVVFTEAERGNPIDQAFCDDINVLSAELSYAADAADVRAVLIRAEGKAFSFGGDLAFFSANQDHLARVILEMTAQIHPAIARMQRMNAPIVGAVHGVCAGGMASFMAGVDLRVAAEEARFVAAYAGIGFSCDAGSSVMLTRRMGLSRARRYLLLNETLDAKTALATGLADEVVPAAQLLERTRALAEKLAAGPTRAFGETRRLLLSATDQSLETQLELEAQALARIAQSDDGREGIAAFTAKRKPKFTGR